jgi:hypothetical protein
MGTRAIKITKTFLESFGDNENKKEREDYIHRKGEIKWSGRNGT